MHPEVDVARPGGPGKNGDAPGPRWGIVHVLQPVVKVRRCTENGEAPGWQGVTTENIGNGDAMLNALVVLMLSFGAFLGAQVSGPKKAPPPTTVRLYVFDCGLLNISPEGVMRYHVTPAEVGETRMPVPCFLVAHPKGTLMWDVGVIPDAIVERQATAGGAHYAVNATTAAVVQRTLKSQLAAIGYSPANITYVAISHAHKDHSANLNAFAASTWLVRPAEREFMWKPGNERVEPSFYTELQHSKSIVVDKDEHDVFGDGTVVIKAAPGHTPDTRY